MQRFRSRFGALVGVGLVVLVAAVVAAIALTRGPVAPSPSASLSLAPSATPSPTVSPSPSASPSPLAVCPMNGTALADPTLATRTPILVQIENNPIARPPSGLNLADLVIEAPVEGDTTRFGAVFMCRPTVGEPVGPVRSARYFNIDEWQQMRDVTFHFGGGHKVIARFDQVGMPYVNGLTAGWSFFARGGSWPAPHNVFLDVDAGRQELETGALTGLAARAGPVRAPFAFADAPDVPAGRPVATIGLRTSSTWRFGWEWDPATKLWLRTDAGEPNFDALDRHRISARTVIVQTVEEDILAGELDPGGYPRRYQHLVGSGTGVLFTAGEAHDVRWSRPTADDVTTWTYADSGDPVVLPAGRVWWEIVPVGSAISED
jgi:hypothetical protein